LSPAKHLGPLADEEAEKLRVEMEGAKKTEDELRVERELKMRPPLARMLSCQDLEARQSYRKNSLLLIIFPHI
jgi:hypothetical protein